MCRSACRSGETFYEVSVSHRLVPLAPVTTSPGTSSRSTTSERSATQSPSAALQGPRLDTG